ncbi:MAG: hypothetical protein MJ105_08505 [Lachnospiraceae bacterium]|nr:hypothetical protein [Lachnospiraceae bacterium]
MYNIFTISEAKIIKTSFTIEKIKPFSEEEKDRFQRAIDTVSFYAKGLQGIGSYQEKSVHAVLKHYFAPDRSCQEIPVGQYVADAVKDGEIYEVQTKDFYRMKGKLDCFLKNYDITIVYPVIIEKTVRWVDPATGEVSEALKSPRKGSIFSIFQELYGIKEYLKKKKLHFMMIFMNAEEYKLLDGYGKDKKRRATKADRVPTEFLGEYILDGKKDYKNLLPESLPKQFTTKELKSLTKCTTEQAQIFVNILSFIGCIKEVGRQGRCKLYEIPGRKS